MKDLLKMVGELVGAQAGHSRMAPDELNQSIKKVYRALKWAERQEAKAVGAAEAPALAWQQSIRKNNVICLECGKNFRQLTGRHLALHGLDPKGYKKKHGIPTKQSLSSRSLSAKRRRVAKERGLGEKLRRARKGSK